MVTVLVTSIDHGLGGGHSFVETMDLVVVTVLVQIMDLVVVTVLVEIMVLVVVTVLVEIMVLVVVTVLVKVTILVDVRGDGGGNCSHRRNSGGGPES